MKIHNVEQGSEEWMAMRAGMPTASEFTSLLTPKKWELSKSLPKYATRLAAELILGRPLDRDLSRNEDVQRGIHLEEKAALSYEFETGETLTTVGFITDDESRYGASPDRLVGEYGLLEIKCPRPENHASYVLNGFDDAYFLQVQGQLLVTGRQWCDRYSYCPGLRPYRERTERDEICIEALKKALSEVHDLKMEYVQKLMAEEAA